MADQGPSDSSSESSGTLTAPTSPESSPKASRNGNVRANNLFGNRNPVSHVPDVAICGLGVRLPGGIRNGDDFWDLLRSGRDARSAVPTSRYNLEGFDDSLGGKDAVTVTHGYFLEEDLSRLDTSFFTLTRNELGKTDPQQRMLLEVTRECLEDAGEVSYRGQLIGCYVGTFGEDWLMMSAKEPQQSGGYIVTGHADLMMANRLSYEYDFRGPSMVIRTGCSSSLLGLHEAFRAIQAGDATAAVVAGASLITTPTLTATMSAGEVLASDGSCKTFDASANGYARAEAITAVYIKRLDDAIRDGNPIQAVIRGTATNCDGKSKSLVTPNGIAQEALIRKAYKSAGLDPRDTAFMECHGTGTATGDPIETTAVGKVFGNEGIYIGSVKPNLGHSEGSAGITSVIKAVLALQHKTIPPNIKFNDPNPKIPFSQYKLTVPVVPTPFPPDRRQRISINSFGIGGSNAHVILESYSQPGQVGHANGGLQINGNKAKPDDALEPELVLFSANTESSLHEQIRIHQDWIRQHPESSSDMAYTRALHREQLPHRGFAIVDQGEFTETSEIAKAPEDAPPVFVVFSGQGAQWPEMCRDLISKDAGFRNDIVAMDRRLQELSHAPPWNMIDELLKPRESSQIHKAELSQPLCTAIQIALFNKFASLGLEPSAVVGHSSGEIAAAYASGHLSMEEAITVAYYRGYVTRQQKLSGAMAAVGMGANNLSEYLCEGVVVACENSPNSSTISGDADKVRGVIEAIKQALPDTFARELKVDMAYHSHHMVPLSAEYQALLEAELRTSPKPSSESKVSCFSSVTGKLAGDELGSPAYWVANLTSPVRFSSAVSNLTALNNGGIFLEIGPHSTLAGPLRQICAAIPRPCDYVSSLSRGKDSMISFLSAIGKLYQGGAALDFKPLFPGGKALSGLPTYPWDHSASYWHESRVSKDWRSRRYPHHCLLGARTLECSEAEPEWRNILQVEDVPWLSDHKVQHDIVFPFAGYIAIAGEAARQLTHSSHENGYRLRHIVAHTALLLSASTPIELMTTLRRYKLNDNEDSEWYEFSVSSYNGSTWVKHCDGQVAISNSIASSQWKPEVLPRAVSCPRIYESLSKVGFVYGPEFRSLENVTSSCTEELAIGQIVNRSQQSRAPFTLHPATIDACLQLLLVARAKGIGRHIVELCVPTVIEDLEIGPGPDIMWAKAWNQYGNKDWPCIECIADEKLVLRASGIEFRPLGDDGGSGTVDVHAAARLKWLPDFDFLDVSNLFTPPESDRTETKLQEQLTLLLIMETAERIRYIQPCQPHFARFRDWMNQQIGWAAAGRYKLVDESEQYVRLSRNERLELLSQKTEELLKLPKKAFTVGSRLIFDNIEKIFTGETNALDILLEQKVLASLYDSMAFDYTRFISLLSHTRPNLRILEVGAGTGGTTETILRSLAGIEGMPAYSTYTFTDVSAGFFPAAKERFADSSNIEFKVFDITKDAGEQGFTEDSYDVIIASNVIHATPSLQQSLGNLRPLLKSDGMLVMNELCSVSRASNYIFGNFVGWWLGEADGRPDQPYVPVSRWEEDLKAVGFTGVDAACYDDEEPYRHMAVMVSRKQAKEVVKPSKVTILSNNPEDQVTRALVTSVQEQGWEIVLCGIANELPQEQHIISCLDLETNFFESITAEGFATFQKFIASIGDRKILWLTSPAQVKCQNPASAQSLGVARTVRSELGVAFHTLEINQKEPDFGSLVARVFHKVCAEEDKDNLDSDKEFVVDNGVICVGRYHPFSLVDEVRQKSNRDHDHSQLVKSLGIDQPGMLETLTWKGRPMPKSIPETHVEIEVRSAGLNFRDVVYAMGLITSGRSKAPLGMEVSGTVRRLGSAVEGLKVGDRVMSFTYEDGFSTHMVVADHFVRRVPEGMSFDAAATIQGCFATAVYALMDIGRLCKGMTVLIHSACGGVGLAAIQVVQMMGGEIFTTVGSEKKREYLIANYGIPADHIFYSRDVSFLEGVMQQTAGNGVDLVLNSLSGELLHASWKCVARNGSLLELGKRDLAGYGKLDLSRFLSNRSYCGVDVAYLLQHRPLVIRDVLQRTLGFFEQGLLRPLEPVTLFDAAEAPQAFRYLQTGDHIGKVILSLPADSSQLEASPSTQSIKFDADSAFLLVGGIGGLGRSLATWLVERGARNLVFLSRNASDDPASNALSTELQSMGCSVTLVKGSVNRLEDVRGAIEASPARITGVFHLAMVQRDSPLVDMKWADWVDANEPKVRGTWNLHEAFLDHPLDMFWLASSTVTVVDQPGQGNYKAGSTFMEAFCQYRHSLGLAASVLCICPIHDVGYVAENPWALRNIKLQGLYTLGEKEFLESVEGSLLNSSPAESTAAQTESLLGGGGGGGGESWQSSGHIIMGLRSELHLDDAKNATNWRRDRRMGVYHNAPAAEAASARTDSERLRGFLDELRRGGGAEDDVLGDEATVEFLAVETGRKIYDFLLKPDADADVDVTLGLSQMGLDSLTAIELRRWFRQTFQVQISVLEMMGASSLRQVGEVGLTYSLAANPPPARSSKRPCLVVQASRPSSINHSSSQPCPPFPFNPDRRVAVVRAGIERNWLLVGLEALMLALQDRPSPSLGSASASSSSSTSPLHHHVRPAPRLISSSLHPLMSSSLHPAPRIAASGLAHSDTESLEDYRFSFESYLDYSASIEVDSNPWTNRLLDTASVTESIYEFYKENGRTYHSYRAGSYYYPNDSLEVERLDSQYEIIKILMDGRSYLAPWSQENPPTKVLDIATGSGCWPIDMGDEFPEAQITGTDLSPIQNDLVPPNVQFIIDDATDEWPNGKEWCDFDFVHTRATFGCWSSMLDQVIRPAFERLRPGGWMESQELMGMLECDDESVTSSNAFKKWCDEIVDASEKADRPLPLAEKLKSWYVEAGFVDVHEKVYKIPVNGWPKVRKLKRLGEMWQENIEDGLQGFSYALLHRVKGMTKEEIEVSLVDVRKDLADKRMHGYQKLYVVWGRKPGDLDEEML
ncbi:Lovastatin diketide synthase LovF [Neonectria ditissima]|uniref:Lovastatin diketide synthase LovF n=1 Tax=Neonectria ditissima TaxID=78410 RepID=A0A0P7B863_9HYPO|nr:Lovastatin diketide synthase LovF [Neonectria ditissima]